MSSRISSRFVPTFRRHCGLHLQGHLRRCVCSRTLPPDIPVGDGGARLLFIQSLIESFNCVLLYFDTSLILNLVNPPFLFYFIFFVEPNQVFPVMMFISYT
jgi:hypothetical protein